MTEEELAKKIGYEGCRNCEHQIAPLRSCKWAEQGGDGIVHIICPMWKKRGETKEIRINGLDELGDFDMLDNAPAVIKADKGETE